MERIAGVAFIVLGGIFIAFKDKYAALTLERQQKLRKNVEPEKWTKRAKLVVNLIGYGWIIIGGILLFQG